MLHMVKARIDQLLQLLLPVTDCSICYFSLPDVTDNAYYLYRHLLRTRNGLDHLWLVQDIAVADRMHIEFQRLTVESGTTGNTLQVKRRRSLTGYFLHLRSRYLFYTERIYTASAQYRNGRVAVSLWHGMPIKDIACVGRDATRWNRTYGHLHIASSNFFKDIIAISFDTKPDSVLVCRSPRCDALQFPDVRELTIGQVRSRLGVPPDRKLIVWLPTFRTEPGQDHGGVFRSFLDDLPGWVLPQLNRYCHQKGAVIVLKLHKSDRLNDRGDVRIDGIRLLRTSDWARQEIQLYDLLAASDAIISDVSSVLIDYIPTGRPIGILGYDPATYPRKLTFSFQQMLNSARFHHIEDEAAIESFVRKVTDGEMPIVPPDDFARLLHEEFSEHGSEAIVARVGL